jgi:hypothetical protein
MKKLILLSCLLSSFALSSCGYSSVENEAVGQVKKVMNMNPILCPNYKMADIIIGSQQALYIQNASGAAPHTMIVVTSEQDKILREAAEKGKTIKFTYDQERVVFCTKSDHFMRSVEIIN